MASVDSLQAVSPEIAALKTQLREFWRSLEGDASPDSELNPHESKLREVASSFIPQGSQILDVACGFVKNWPYCAERGAYFGCDLSLNYLRGTKYRDARLACSDADSLPFASGAFGAVICTYSLEHSVNPRGMLREMRRVAASAGRIILLGPSWDFPFWYPASLESKAKSRLWRIGFSLKRALRQTIAMAGGPSPFEIVRDPDAFHHPFVSDADAVYVLWAYEVIRDMRQGGFRLLHAEVDTPLLGENSVARLFKNALRRLPAYRYAGSTALLVFERMPSAEAGTGG